MAPPTIVTDVHGLQWRVTRADTTGLGFDLLRGRPARPQRQGETIILTDDLRQVLEALRDAPAQLADLLPLGRTTIKRLRRELGHHWRDDRADWYLERLDDLASLTGSAFAARHQVSEAAASLWRQRLLGPRLRPAGWWREPEARAIILQGSAEEAAAALAISEGSARRLRWTLRQEDATADAE